MNMSDRQSSIPSVHAAHIRSFLGLAVAIALVLLPIMLTNERAVYFVCLAVIWAIFAVGYDFLFGVTGHLSFGHAAFFGGGAYVAALLMIKVNLPFSVALLGAMISMALAAFVFGLIALRASGIHFALITLLLGELVYVLVSVKLRHITGGFDGLSGVPRPTFLGIDFYDDRRFCVLVNVIGLILFVFAVRVRASPLGQVLHGIRQNPLRLRQIGFNVRAYTLTGFILSGAYAGVAGALLASLIMFVGPELLHWTISGEVVIITVLGGLGTVIGPILGVVSVEALREVLSSYTTAWHGLLGLLFILFSVVLPRGLWGLIAATVRKARRT